MSDMKAKTPEELEARQKVLEQEIAANEEENRFMQSELDAIYAEQDDRRDKGTAIKPPEYNVPVGRIFQEVGKDRLIRVLAVWPIGASSDHVQRAPDVTDRSARHGCATIITWDGVRNAPAGRPTFAKLCRFGGKSGGYRLVQPAGK